MSLDDYLEHKRSEDDYYERLRQYEESQETKMQTIETWTGSGGTITVPTNGVSQLFFDRVVFSQTNWILDFKGFVK